MHPRRLCGQLRAHVKDLANFLGRYFAIAWWSFVFRRAVLQVLYVKLAEHVTHPLCAHTDTQTHHTQTDYMSHVNTTHTAGAGTRVRIRFNIEPTS